MKQHYRMLGAIVVILFLNVMLMGMTLSNAQPQPNGNVRTAYHLATGKVRFIGASVSNPVTMSGVTSANLTTEANSNALLNVYAPQFGVANPAQDLQFVREYKAEANTIIRRYQQTYQGIPVFGGELVLTLTPSGGLVSLVGEIGTDLAIPTVPTVSDKQASAAAVAHVAGLYGLNAAGFALNAAPQLMIYDPRLLDSSNLQAAELVWRADVVATAGQPVRMTVLINALMGTTRLSFNRLHTEPQWVKTQVGALPLPSASEPTILAPIVQANAPRVGGQPDLATYDYNNSEFSATLVCEENDMTCTEGTIPDADSAHLFAQQTYMMYWNWHNRDSLNGTGFKLNSYVRYAVGYCNAFWNGSEMTYGDGCPSSIVRDDVVSHELTHGFTEFTSGLVYFSQSGAINESLSDVWGEFLDLTNSTAEDTPENRWVMGEEIFPGGFRNMKNPTVKYDPDRVRSPFYFSYPADNQGVHINSGISNKAAYLMAEGDTFNNYTVAGIGIRKTSAIYYRAQTTKLTASSDYNDLGDYLNQSCTELIGTVIDGSEITASDCTQVQNAVLATQMNLAPDPKAPTAALCPADSAQNLFFDTLENGDANWSTAALVGSNGWVKQSTNPKINGNFSLHGADLATISDSVVAMVNDVNLPASAYLHFLHKFVFEGDSTGAWDGGIVEYSTNGGSTWTQLVSQYSEGQPYIWTLPSGYGNPLGGKIAFGFSSRGTAPASTRYDLSGLAGQNVRFRFRIGSDNAYGATGWTIDDIRIYTCGVIDESDLIVNGGMENDANTDTIPDTWVGKNLVGDKHRCNTNTKTFSNTGECAFVFRGGAGESSSITQSVDLTGRTLVVGDTLDLSAFIKATSQAAAGKVKLRVKYSDGTATGKVNLAINTNTLYTELSGEYALTSAAVSTILVQIQHKSLGGKVHVDDVSLVLLPVASMTVGRNAGTNNITTSDQVIPLPESSVGGRGH